MWDAILKHALITELPFRKKSLTTFEDITFGMNRTFSEWIGTFNGEAFHLAMSDCVQQFLRPEVTFFGLPLCFQHPPVGLVWSVRFVRFNY